MTPAQFVADFPEFANATTYPVSTIQFWINVAGQLLNPSAWGSLLSYGTELFVAHNLVLSQQAVASAVSGGLPGSGSGITASKSIDKVSVSYDVSAGTIAGAGSFNLTNYGTRYMQLANMAGMGGIQVSGNGCWVPEGGFSYTYDLGIAEAFGASNC